ncbi:hypothetical protein COW97_01780 [Candidatus Roizmanbacteria bacterium CG22_combo_CG10-13_8_21_14_all_34_12]|uniref:DUF3048 domain-containing protein n=1 Tax=Candidatus Roizmanbacteria bacterium CG22_combo_CG10-13_8_21_14_all_34_12 TaxID=1974860 RepID=A0A2H0C0Y6_9BACT|nr:MAG: hypothetical protein COW97_01780 [Candidatus Roizmanbacteria bacterium CG22_combo_CG10-13_8_21_14_all_34_12]
MINKKIAFVVVFILFILSGITTYSFFSEEKGLSFLSPITYKAPISENSTTETAINAEPKTEECPLNGEMLSKTEKTIWEGQRPLGIMIENHKEARPQSGLSSADIVYEAVSEGGITRFLAIFYCKNASYIGPVRSARMYFLKFLEGYGQNPLYAHVGGANTDGPADALGYINELGWSSYNDLNQFSVPFPHFWRDYERLKNVATEHTVYTSTKKLWQYAKDKRELTNVDDQGVRWDKGFEPWKFEDDVKTSDPGKVVKIDFGFWDSLASDFNVVWNYNSTTNSYKRTNGGLPHLDKNTGKQLEAKNIVVMFAKESPANDGYEGGHLLYKNVGSGEMLFFKNGQVVRGAWGKETEEDNIKFFDNSDKEISMVRGQVFIEMLPIGNKVNY